MIRQSILVLVFSATLPSSAGLGQQLKSGPQKDEALPGSFQPLNINGKFAGRHHCLVTEFRLSPVVLVFARTPPDRIDPEVKRLVESVEKAVDDRHGETGMESFVVFLSAYARSVAGQDQSGDSKAALGDAINRERADTINREKLVGNLKELATPFKSLIVTCISPESIGEQYRLAENAEVTVVIYSRHRVDASFAFASGELNQAGIETILKSMEAVGGRLKKGAGRQK